MHPTRGIDVGTRIIQYIIIYRNDYTRRRVICTPIDEPIIILD